MDISALYQDTTLSIDAINKSLDEDNKKANIISQNLGQKIEEKLTFLGLEDDQEREVIDIIDSSTRELRKLIDKQSHIKDALHYIVHKMNKCIKKT